MNNNEAMAALNAEIDDVITGGDHTDSNDVISLSVDQLESLPVLGKLTDRQRL